MNYRHIKYHELPQLKPGTIVIYDGKDFSSRQEPVTDESINELIELLTSNLEIKDVFLSTDLYTPLYWTINSRRASARKAGSVKSLRKAGTSRANGAKGGRPPLKPKTT